MNEASIIQDITDTFPGVETATHGGYTFFFYGADRKLPFVTLAQRSVARLTSGQQKRWSETRRAQPSFFGSSGP